MNLSSFARAYTARLATLLGTASVLSMGHALDAHAADVVAQVEDIPETVLITGSLIRGTTAARKSASTFSRDADCVIR